MDIGLGEWIGLAIVALIVLGPEKLPRYAADAGRMLRQLRKMANEARAEVTKELGPDLQDLGLADLNPRTLVKKHLLDPIDLDELDDLDAPPTRSAKPTSAKPTSAGGPAERPPTAPAAPGTPPPYDEDAT